MSNEYRKLIDTVAKIDHKAALFLARKYPLLVKRGSVNHFKWGAKDPDALVLWTSTPQGEKYWRKLQGVFNNYVHRVDSCLNYSFIDHTLPTLKELHTVRRTK